MKVPLKMSEKKELSKGVYMDKELNALKGLELKSQMVSRDYVIKTNKLAHIMEVVIRSDELKTLITWKTKAQQCPT